MRYARAAGFRDWCGIGRKKDSGGERPWFFGLLRLTLFLQNIRTGKMPQFANPQPQMHTAPKPPRWMRGSVRRDPGFGWSAVLALAYWLMVGQTTAAPSFDPTDAVSFFTNVASRLVADQLHEPLFPLPVYPTNAYTPAVQRLLQLTANIYDATTTNFYPSVFQPLFTTDGTGTNLFLTGYRQVVSVSGPYDAQLAPPVDFDGVNYWQQPFTNGATNFYNVPWIIGVRKGLPNFNQFTALNAVQVARKLEYSRLNLTAPISEYVTNQCYVIGVSNSTSVSFWNSYSNAYPNPVQISGAVLTAMSLSASSNTWNSGLVAARFNWLVSNWPGAQWTNGFYPYLKNPAAASFVSFTNGYSFISPNASFWPSTASFNEGTANFDPGPLMPLPALQLNTTNWIYAVMLDGTHVIDYVQLKPPPQSTNLTWALADPAPGTTPTSLNDGYVWATNIDNMGGIQGIDEQWFISIGLAPIPYGNGVPVAQPYMVAFFAGDTSVNSDLNIQAPYTPVRTLYCPYALQVNDPLVHYTVSDLGGSTGNLGAWQSYANLANNVWLQSDTLPPTLPVPNTSTLSLRFQPWSRHGFALLDTNAYDLALRDPVVELSDDWNFPTNQSWNLSWLGQVHRGTPWQTVYLKSANLLTETNNDGVNIGTNTWMAWTGDGNASDAAAMAPVTDWQIVDLLVNLLGTNNPATQFSVNNPDTGAWAVSLNGLTVASNTLAETFAKLGVVPPTFANQSVSSNDAGVASIVSAIASARAALPGGIFTNIGQLLAVPQLSQQSPYLNWNDPYQPLYGINDQAYEAIPSQLLPQLRTDSVGTLMVTNGKRVLQFSGYDGFPYVVQQSADLVHWTAAGTNTPVNGSFSVTLPVSGPTNSGGAMFYRSVVGQ